MSVDLALETPLVGTPQYVRDQNGNRSSLALSKDGNIGIGTDRPEANGPLTLPGKELIIANLQTPPPTAYTTDLVIDKVTGQIYRQS
jgi:hypothetical protein